MTINAVLHNIRSMYNVGSIFRTADAAGVDKIYLCGITPTPIDKFGRRRTQIAKVALRAEDYVNWQYTKFTTSLLDKLKKDGFIIIAIEQAKNSVPYYNLPAKVLQKNKIALIVGNEIKGLPRPILKQANYIIEIPIRGKKESLNVAVAFGIVAFSLIERLLRREKWISTK